MWLSHSPSYSRSHGSPVKFPLTGKGGIQPHFLKGKKGKPGELQVGQSHLGAQQDHAKAPGDVTGDSHRGFTKGKWCLTNLMANCDRVIVLADEGRATDAIYLGLCKAFDTVLFDVFVSKTERHCWEERIQT